MNASWVIYQQAETICSRHSVKMPRVRIGEGEMNKTDTVYDIISLLESNFSKGGKGIWWNSNSKLTEKQWKDIEIYKGFILESLLSLESQTAKCSDIEINPGHKLTKRNLLELFYAVIGILFDQACKGETVSLERLRHLYTYLTQVASYRMNALST